MAHRIGYQALPGFNFFITGYYRVRTDNKNSALPGDAMWVCQISLRHL